MCTVTIVPRTDAGGPRLVCNRDELRTRSRARFPELISSGNRRRLAPIDADSGGTWVGVNDAGLIATLLNVNLRTPPPWLPTRSRGEIVPLALEFDSLNDVANAVLALDHTDFRPFRLVAALAEEVIEIRSDIEGPHIGGRWNNEVCFFTSSGLGDHLVESPRRALFETMFNDIAPADLAETQDRFHRHVWDDRTELSVNMSRPDAETVSLTVVECATAQVRMIYVDGRPIGAEETVEATLERRAAVR